ncbi:hypothetical protein CSV80_00870 [Sporosarcina sp. P12(2017)]|uniref:LysM peptidoglycan-binding domain-containing protein n=1 Tax=unclassified Sporosarcina TaxID=2647733 RepID=UPI000C16DD18|nr:MULTISPECIES: LysM peptidoglycan-binding domain-containing protein [unclassified Sporosarcina]PIC59108.1 hypothetical protein CSV81_00870 [Sporosarcina sp. P10]PIC62429.1 hypothetical protein CSV80_00870 [Sporosarcina sp. P12(2017)]
MKFSFVDPVNKKTLVLPVPPSSMTVTMGTKVLTFEPTVLGEIELPRGRKPISFSLEGMFPGENQSISDRDSDLTPDYIVETMRSWTESKRPGGKELRFIVTSTDWNIPVFLRDIEPEYVGGYGDIKYTMFLTELRPFTVKEVKRSTSGKKEVRPSKPKPKIHVVVKGDSLWKIAKKYKQKGTAWRDLWNANKKNLKSKNPNLIYPGEKLTIPAGWLK